MNTIQAASDTHSSSSRLTMTPSSEIDAGDGGHGRRLRRGAGSARGRWLWDLHPRDEAAVGRVGRKLLWRHGVDRDHHCHDTAVHRQKAEVPKHAEDDPDNLP